MADRQPSPQPPAQHSGGFLSGLLKKKKPAASQPALSQLPEVTASQESLDRASTSSIAAPVDAIAKPSRRPRGAASPNAVHKQQQQLSTSPDKAPSEWAVSPWFATRPRRTSSATSTSSASSTLGRGSTNGGENDFLNTAYLMMLRDRANQAALDESQQSAPHAALHDGDREVTTGDEAIDDNDTDEDDAIWDDFYVDPYSQQFLTMESTIASANEASAAGSAVSRNGNAVPHPVFQKLPGITERIDATTKLDFPLPLPFARPAASGGNEPELTQQLPLAQTPVKETERWKPPESWIVGNADNIPSAAGSSDASSTVVIQKAIKSGAEVSSIRVFRREGNFVTVSCSLNITAKELCAILAKKLFLTPAQISKYQLFAVRNGREFPMGPVDRPLRLQQMWLWELGYDPMNDRFQDMLREDNSIIYRWVFSDISVHGMVYGLLREAAEIDHEAAARFSLDQQSDSVERKLSKLIQLSINPPNAAELACDIDLSECNLDVMPVVLHKHGRSIRSLDLSGNLAVNLPLDFMQLCSNLTVLKLANFNLQRIPAAVTCVTSLQVLDLSSNLITTLRDSGIQTLVNLRELNLRNNRLFGKNAFAIDVVTAWTRLEKLDISCNWLKGDLPKALAMVGIGAGDEPSALMELDLSYNHLTALPVDFGFRYPRMRKLFLVGNYLSRLPESLREGMKELQELDMRGNCLLRSIDALVGAVTGPAMTVDAIGDLTSSSAASTLSKLLLDNNQLGELNFSQQFAELQSIVSLRNPGLLQVDISSNLPSLTTLVLCSSKLAFLPENIFEHTPALRVLVLSHNQITELPPSIARLHHLVRLDVSHNTLNKLPTCMQEWRSLEILDAHCNNLKEVPAQVWDLRVHSLNLSSNVIERWPEYAVPSGGSDTGNKRFSIYSRKLSSSSSTSVMLKSTVGGAGPPSPRRSSAIGKSYSFTSDAVAGDTATNTHRRSGGFLMPALGSTLQWFIIADNRLETPFFETAVFHMSALRSLNVGHNEVFNVPTGTLRTCKLTLEELVLSGNHLTQAPDDLVHLKRLRRLYLNSNRLGTLPPELGKLTLLTVLDVGRNQLRYNVANWPYDWNWSWNVGLKHFNLSGNPKLEIRPPLVRSATKRDRFSGKPDTNVEPDASEMVKFDALLKIRVLGLFEVPLSVALPEETSSKRVRVYANGGASEHWRKQLGMEAAAAASGANPYPLIANGPGSTPASTQPFIPYGVSDGLGTNDRSNNWDLVLVDCKFVAAARDEAKAAAAIGSTPANSVASTNGDSVPSPEPVPRMRGAPRKGNGECMFALFEGDDTIGTWGAKWLSDNFAQKFSLEVKKVFKERQEAEKLSKPVGGASVTTSGLGSASDHELVQHALRRTFLKINKLLGGMAYSADEKLNHALEMDAIAKLRKLALGMDQATASPLVRRASLYQKLKSTDGPQQQRADGDSASCPILSSSDSNIKTPSEAFITIDRARLPRDEQQSKDTGYMSAAERASDNPSELDNRSWLKLMDSGYSALIVFIVNSQLFVANCGNGMAILSRNGKAVPLTMRHSLASAAAQPPSTSSRPTESTTLGRKQTSAEDSTKPKTLSRPQTAGTLEDRRMSTLAETAAPQLNDKKASSSYAIRAWEASRRELGRIRHSNGYVSREGFVGGETLNTRAFGYYRQSPQVYAAPFVSLTELIEHDEFLIIGSAAFWRTMTYQTAVEIANLKADDALEASMVLRDFAMAYARNAIYAVDHDAETPEEQLSMREHNIPGDDAAKERRRFFLRNPVTVMVVDLKNWVGGRRKVFQKTKRRKDETLDSAIARLAPEVDPPTGSVALVFTDVRNSTNIWERLGIPMRVAIREHNLIMRRNLRYFHGYEVKTEGDAFMVSFQHVLDALRWSMTCQLQLLEADWPREILESYDGKPVYGSKSLDEPDNSEALLYRGLSIRMGIHYGNPVCEMDPTTRRMDYFGPMVNKSARVSGNADGGQILMSQDAVEAYRRIVQEGSMDKAVQEKLAHLQELDPEFISVGERKLKGFDRKEELVSVLPRALIGRHVVPPPPLESTDAAPSTALASTTTSAASDNLDHLLALQSSSASLSTITASTYARRRTIPRLNRGAVELSEGYRVGSESTFVCRSYSTTRLLSIPDVPVSADADVETEQRPAVMSAGVAMEELADRLEKLVIITLTRALERLNNAVALTQFDDPPLEPVFGARDLAVLTDDVVSRAMEREPVRRLFEELIGRVEDAAGSLELGLAEGMLGSALDATGPLRNGMVGLLRTLLSLATRNMELDEEPASVVSGYEVAAPAASGDDMESKSGVNVNVGGNGVADAEISGELIEDDGV